MTISAGCEERVPNEVGPSSYSFPGNIVKGYKSVRSTDFMLKDMKGNVFKITDYSYNEDNQPFQHISFNLSYKHNVVSFWASHVAQWLEPACQIGHMGDTGSIPGLGRSPGEGNATLSSILAWKIPWTEGLVGYSPCDHRI